METQKTRTYKEVDRALLLAISGNAEDAIISHMGIYHGKPGMKEIMGSQYGCSFLEVLSTGEKWRGVVAEEFDRKQVPLDIMKCIEQYHQLVDVGVGELTTRCGIEPGSDGDARMHSDSDLRKKYNEVAADVASRLELSFESESV